MMIWHETINRIGPGSSRAHINKRPRSSYRRCLSHFDAHLNDHAVALPTRATTELLDSKTGKSIGLDENGWHLLRSEKFVLLELPLRGLRRLI